MLLYKGVRKTY